MTDEELRTLRGKLEILRKGTEDFVCATKTADLIEALLNEIDRLKKRLNARDQKIEANAELAREMLQYGRDIADRLKETLTWPEDE